MYSYDADKIARQCLQLISKFNESSDEVNWRPKLRNISVSASKFGEAENNASIQDFFKVNADKEESAQIEMAKCEKCDQEVSPFEMPEHLDYHLAKDLQDELRNEVRIAEKKEPKMAVAPTSKKRTKGQTSNQSVDKKQKTISSFFAKK